MSFWPEGDRGFQEALRVLKDNTSSLDNAEVFPTASLGVLGDAGVLGWVIPREYGGSEFSGAELVEGYLQLARACLPTTFVLTQRNAACQRFALSENEPLKAELLPQLVGSARFVTVGISHLTTSRQHLSQPAVRVKLAEGRIQLDGVVPWVTGAGQADWVLTGGSCEDGRQVLVALPMDSRGITVLPAQDLLALDSSQTASIQLENVLVDEGLLVAGPVEGVMHSGGRGGTGSLGTSALALGAASSSLERLAEEARNRPELDEVLDLMTSEWEQVAGDVLSASGEAADSQAPELTNESLRQRSNSLVLRAAQAHLAASKGAGFTASHSASRSVRESMFFLVWSCPQAVVAANLREFAGLLDGPMAC
ncbi:MAG: isovaleryl-CoA dehydrogenase [Planctomycetaceae bacterium]|nr:isovaleryl-CoA dehydrogenase [Planctomycetaceae bacterium]|tara:strand:+ start:6133 stop:7233 length:1101 start_codon:yes stop_codon:yes gene_type:complete